MNKKLVRSICNGGADDNNDIRVMKYIFLYLLLILTSCSNNEDMTEDGRFLSFAVRTVNKTFDCEIDNETNRIYIPEITDGKLITSVEYKLTPGAEVEPKPESRIGVWSKTEKFRVYTGTSERVYEVIIKTEEEETEDGDDEGQEANPFYANIYLGEKYGRYIKHLFFDLKYSQVSLNDESNAKQQFGVDMLDGVRIPIHGNGANGEYTGHNGPGMDDIKADDYKKLISSVKNALKYNPDLMVFAGKKLSGETSFPDWMKEGNSINADKYVEMLISYLKYMKANGITVHVLGIDNEPEYSRGNIDAAKYIEIVEKLKKRITDEGLYVPRFIAPERFSPQGFTPNTFMYKLFELDEDCSTMDIYGTHYYPRHHTYKANQKLISDVTAAMNRNMEIWATEPHWGSHQNEEFGRDMLGHSKMAMCTLFDHTDIGVDNIMWWDYPNKITNLRASLIRELSLAVHNSQPIKVVDHDGEAILHDNPADYTTNWKGTNWAVNNDPVFNENLHTRAFIRNDGEVNLFVINVKYNDEIRNEFNDNNGPGKLFNDYVFNVKDGIIDGEVKYTQWTDDSEFTGIHSIANKTSDNEFTIDIPIRSITKITFRTK